MADNEDWRRQRAEELGLVDNGPWLGSRSRPVARPVAPRPKAAPIESGSPVAPVAISKAGVVLKPWMAVAALAALIAAAALGWLLRGGMETPPRPVAVSRPSEPVPPPMVQPPAVVPAPTTAPEGAPITEAAGPAEPVALMVLPAPASRLPKRPRAGDTRRVTATPSFNCARSATAVGRMICTNPDLAALDREMSARYRARVARSDLATERRLDDAQSAFLNARSRCSDRACVERVSRERIAALQ